MATDTTLPGDDIQVSVCIANFNGADVLDACLQSVLTQTTTIDIEIIVHDDASDDDSVCMIKNKYPFVSLITSEKNVGFCIANNRMANMARGKYLLLLNNDAELFPDAIETLLAAAKLSQAPSIFGLPQYTADTHQFMDCGAFLDPFFNAVPRYQLTQTEVAMVAGACLWIPKNVWVEIDGFPAWFESIAEDLYLCCRARLAGYQVIALGTSGFYHRVGNSFGGGKVNDNRLSTTFRRRALSERNKLFTMLVIVPELWLYVCLPFQVLLLLVEGALLALWKRQWCIWCDIYAPLIPAIFNYRAQWLVLRKMTQQHKQILFYRWMSIMQWQPYKLQMLIKYGIPDIK